jgi:lysophospholipase L1-like esterase
MNLSAENLINKTKAQISVLGDSVLKGIILNQRGRYEILPSNCAAEMNKKSNIIINNKSRFGCTITKGWQMLQKTLDSGITYDYIVLEFGGNDCDFKWNEVSDNPSIEHKPRTSLTEFIATYRLMIETLLKHKIKPVLVSLPPVNGQRYLDYLVSQGLNRENLLYFLHEPETIYRYHEAYSLSVTRLAGEYNCAYAPVREEFLAKWNQPDFLCADGIHPNESGHRLMQNVFENMSMNRNQQHL